jgi:hypothetical protein
LKLGSVAFTPGRAAISAAQRLRFGALAAIALSSAMSGK